MPHDKNGKELKAGDLVTVTCRVVQTFSYLDYCNVNLETCEPMSPDAHYCGVSLNSRQVEKLDEHKP